MSRNKARQQALQILFSREFHGENDIQYAEREILESDEDAVVEEAVDQADQAGDVQEDVREDDNAQSVDDEADYCSYLVTTTWEHVEELDQIISSLSRGWKLSQMDRTDKNVLRMALCELNYPKEVLDESIIINEAIRLAKRYGGPASSKFVNGILGTYVRTKA